VGQGVGEDFGGDGVSGGYAEGRLDREGGDGGGAEAAVRGYDGEVGGDPGAGGGVVAGYGQEGFDGGSLCCETVSDRVHITDRCSYLRKDRDCYARR
jgi:hypothetical protein